MPFDIRYGVGPLGSLVSGLSAFAGGLGDPLRQQGQYQQQSSQAALDRAFRGQQAASAAAQNYAMQVLEQDQRQQAYAQAQRDRNLEATIEHERRSQLQQQQQEAILGRQREELSARYPDSYELRMTPDGQQDYNELSNALTWVSSSPDLTDAERVAATMQLTEQRNAIPKLPFPKYQGPDPQEELNRRTFDNPDGSRYIYQRDGQIDWKPPPKADQAEQQVVTPKDFRKFMQEAREELQLQQDMQMENDRKSGVYRPPQSYQVVEGAVIRRAMEMAQSESQAYQLYRSGGQMQMPTSAPTSMPSQPNAQTAQAIAQQRAENVQMTPQDAMQVVDQLEVAAQSRGLTPQEKQLLRQALVILSQQP